MTLLKPLMRLSQTAYILLQTLDRSAGSGLVYLQRPSGEGAKAGNLNHARLHSSGEVILVLDAGKPKLLLQLNHAFT